MYTLWLVFFESHNMQVVVAISWLPLLLVICFPIPSLKRNKEMFWWLNTKKERDGERYFVKKTPNSLFQEKLMSMLSRSILMGKEERKFPPPPKKKQHWLRCWPVYFLTLVFIQVILQLPQLILDFPDPKNIPPWDCFISANLSHTIEEFTCIKIFLFLFFEYKKHLSFSCQSIINQLRESLTGSSMYSEWHDAQTLGNKKHPYLLCLNT